MGPSPSLETQPIAYALVELGAKLLPKEAPMATIRWIRNQDRDSYSALQPEEQRDRSLLVVVAAAIAIGLSMQMEAERKVVPSRQLNPTVMEAPR